MTLKETLLNSLAKVKAKDVLCYNTKEKSPFFDEMILATVTNERSAYAVVSYIEDDLAKEGYKLRNIEGKDTGWVLIDANDIIVSVFTEEERAHFDVEKIYMDLPVEKIDLDKPVL